MKDFPKVSDAEWQVMEVVWTKHPLTASEIIEAIRKNSQWSPKTIHTLISRLVKKGALEVTKTTNFYQYSPTVSQVELRKVETQSFVQKIYNGSLHLLLSNFIKEEQLTLEEIEDLKKVLDDKLNK